MRLSYLLRSGKNPKWLYYLENYSYYYLPKGLARRRMQRLLAEFSMRPDYDYICQRLDYYNAMPHGPLPAEASLLSWHKPKRQKVYFFDSYRYSSLFPQSLRWCFLPGDITHVPTAPSIVKSRPLAMDNRNSILMKLDKVRHFTFVEDHKPWREKKDMAIFRGKVLDKACRLRFMQLYYGHPMVDAADVGRHAHPQWQGQKRSIAEHLDYKFVLALEGNDVASNLKWIMSSQCLALMPPPTCETWFMEGTLKPGVHYVPLRPDLSDLEEQMHYYIEHPEEAETIISNANSYVSQFLDEEREELISYLVLERYFERSGQLPAAQR